MKILQVVGTMDPRAGGVTEAVRQMSEAAIALGCEVEAATFDLPDTHFAKTCRFPIHGLGPFSTAFAYSPRMLPWLLKHGRTYDVLVINGLWQYHSFAVRQAARKLGIPYAVFPHGMLDPYFKRAHRLKHMKKWLYWPWGDYLVLRDAAAVCFTTEEERLGARESFWLYSAKERVLNLGIAPPPGDANANRAAFYLRYPELAGKRLAVFLGRIHPKKGCDLAIRAFAEVFGADSNWHLLMAGPDQVGWQAELEKLAASLSIAGRTTFTGMISGDEKWGALQAAEFFFLPSHQENFGMVVAEALACGVPVLISDKINIWREVTEAQAGLVAPDTLAGAISLLQTWRAMTNTQQANMRAKTLVCFEEKFEIRQAASQLVETLRQLAGQETPSSSRMHDEPGVLVK
jgi:glycosyltransferase involved in cell wall biosynthesis